MRALFNRSTTSNDHNPTPESADQRDIPRTLSKPASTSQLSSFSAPSVTISSPEDSIPRRAKSKSSLRSTGSNHHDEEYDSLDKTLVRPSFLRRLSPGLAARVKLLDGNAKTTISIRNHTNVGRIPEEQIKELDSLHQSSSRSVKVERKGKAWSGQNLGEEKRKEGVTLRLGPPRLELEEEPDEESEQRTSEITEPLVTLSAEQIVASIPHAPKPPAVYERSATESEKILDPTAAMSAIESALALLRPDQDSESHTDNTSHGQTDFEKYIQSSTENYGEGGSPTAYEGFPSRSSSISSLHRAESVFSFSRNSFSNQLAQLTSIALPQPSSLAASISSIPTAPAAIKALIRSAEQIHTWINKASNVLTGLYAEDDVEWAAAGGRDGLDGVDRAITRFESVVNVYVKAIEDVQLRHDISDVDPEYLKKLVSHMENILNNWAHIKSKLRQVKEQVELAMEWEELWNNVLGDVSMEMDDLSRLIFEMEEKRHEVADDGPVAAESSGGLDINDLETIVEEAPSSGDMSTNKRFSIGPIFSSTPMADTPIIQTPQNETSLSDLTALFARMQPLRASLDFLPMRISMFQSRAEDIFPSACEELEERQSQLERSYKRLSEDAEALRKELGEDRWVRVFRSASGQAQRMFDSVERGIAKLQEAIEMGAHLHNTALLTKRMEGYEAKKLHYVPAIEQVITIIQKGVKDRLTVNGEILRSLSDMKARLDALKTSIKVMDSSLEDINAFKMQHSRDSVSSSLTLDSPGASSVIDTPGSSPASSVVMTPAAGRKTSSRRGSSVVSMSKVKRYSGIPQVSTALTKKSALPKPSTTTPSSSKPNTPSSISSLTPASAARAKRASQSSSTLNNRPRWNSSTNTRDLDVGHNFKPLSATTPSPYARSPSVPRRPMSTADFRGSFSRESSRSPAPMAARPASRVSSRLAPRTPSRGVSPSPARSILDPPPYSKRRQQSGESDMLNVPRMRQSYAGASPFSRSTGSTGRGPEISSPPKARPGTALGHSHRRISLLPQPKARSGRDTSSGSRSKLDERPPWR
ncbi:hypothetical protein MPDQ_007867 [Monascus purpureus]|uniref:Karyogamy protein n=1 Tax=Monascus purpureus TaxID=5098 RepID=A0A507R4X2_MONPU|nr:hypothetical protein MPDQ_007867 [Monascus purpureus]